MTGPVRTRYAPSPTGVPHVGNIRTALFDYLLARHFASRFGPAFYGLPQNVGTITLRREEWRVPHTLAFGKERLVPLRAGETIPWKLA